MELYWEDRICPTRNGVGLDSLLKYKAGFLCAVDKSEQEIDNFIVLRWK